MNLVQNALDLIEKNLDIIYTHGSLLERASASFLKARCLLAQSSGSGQQPDRQVLPLLTRAGDMFQRIEAFYHLKDVVFFEALLHHRLGSVKERNTRAMHFRQLEEQYPAKCTPHSIMIFISL